MSTSKIKINPVTKEIEIEVSDEFLLKYFESLGIFLTSSKKIKVSKTEKTIEKKTKKNTTKVVKQPKGAIQEAVLEVIKKAKDEGVTKKDIVDETGLDKVQITGAINTLKKEGVINTIDRGVYKYVKPVVENE